MLTVHLTVSVGWIGAVVAYLALVVAAGTSQDAQLVRAAWIAMELIILFVIVPLALASLLTGLIMSLGTKWGLFRHYWVLISFILTVFATVVLLGHVTDVSAIARVVTETDTANAGGLGADRLHNGGRMSTEANPDGNRGGLASELLHAGGGLLVLLVVQVLNIYKPRGLTPYGWRKQQEH
jgi:hypothetical protein